MKPRKGKRLTFANQETDYETGEVKKTYTRTLITDNGFRFVTNTKGTVWYKNLSGSELKLLMYMTEIQSLETKKVILDKPTKESISKIFEVGVNQIEKTLRILVEKNLVLRVNRGVYLINPVNLYQGNTDLRHDEIETYETLKIELKTKEV